MSTQFRLSHSMDIPLIDCLIAPPLDGAACT